MNHEMCPRCTAKVHLSKNGTPSGLECGSHIGDVRFTQSYQCLEAERDLLMNRVLRLEPAILSAMSWLDFYGPSGMTPDSAKLMREDLANALEQP